MSSNPPPDQSAPIPGSGPPSRPIEPRRDTGPLSGAHWTKRPTHQTGARGAMPGELPDLVRYANVPRYDLTTVADFVGVRPVTLWSWEQNLGVPLLDPLAEASTGARYSERDLIALVWLREQVVAGADAILAAQKLREALAALQGVPAPQYPMTGSMTPGSVPRTPSRPLNSRILRPGADRPSQPIARPTPSRPVEGAIATGPAVYAGQVPATDLREMIQPLIRALQLLDVRNATQLLDTAFTTRSVETTCQNLIIPVMSRLVDLQTQRDITQPEMQFAVNLFKGRLFRLFDVLHETPEAPLAFVACGPSEVHELDALMVALHWRRVGLRIVYFGQDVDDRELAEAARKHRPRVVALTISTTARVKLVERLGRDLAKIDRERPPRLALIGTGMARQTDLQQRVHGTFLGITPGEATQALTTLLRG